jgi:hypothetical protein
MAAQRSDVETEQIERKKHGRIRFRILTVSGNSCAANEPLL